MSENRSLLMSFRSGKWSIASRIVAVAAMHGLCANAYAANILPTGGQYVAGSGAISTGSKSVVVNQSSKTGIVNWQGFSIGSGNTVQFNNGSGATLNRVTGGNLSQIDGMLKATGSVYLINPQGIVVGPGGKIVTNGSFVGSTRDVSDDDFMKGKALHASGTSAGTVVNKGSITSLYGDTILVGSSVSNSGNISAPNGTAGLAAGNDVTLRPSGSDPRIAVSAGKGDVTNTGTVAAAQAELAAAGGNVYALAGNSGGLISATGSKTVDGHVWLTSSGTTQVAGAVNAANADGTGGTIVATGKTVQVDATARISANGTTGGTVLIGGDQKGGSDPASKRVHAAVANAQTTTVANGAQISADGTQDAGGAVVIWSDDHTLFDGSLSATGVNGSGGDAEVSSHDILDFTGLVDLTSKYASIGNLLLDPRNVTISSGTTSGISLSGGTYTPSANSSVLNVNTLTTALASSNITVTTGSSGSQAGTIAVSAAINWTAATTLTLNAASSISITAGITNTNGGLNIKAGASSAVTDTAAVNVKNFTLTSGNWSQNTASLPSFSAANFVISGGTFLRVAGGDGSSTPYQITDIYGLQGMIGFTSSNFSLAGDIDASSTANWNGGAGFTPLTLDANTTFDGQNHTVSNLTINQPGNNYIALIGTNNGTVQNIKLSTPNITGSSYVAALVGQNNGTVNKAQVIGGSVSGVGSIGGLVGQSGTQYAVYNPDGSCCSIVNQPGYIYTSSSSATVTGIRDPNACCGAPNVGGLVGASYGPVSNSFATGNVTALGGFGVGGLMGYNAGTVTNSYATGNVFTGTDGSDGNYGEYVGGLLGENTGNVSLSHASGNVSGYEFIGGLIGASIDGNVAQNGGASSFVVSDVYATGNVTGAYSDIGGLIGANTGATLTRAYATGTVTETGSYASNNPYYVGGLIGEVDGGTISQVYATGTVNASEASAVGGLIGALMSASTYPYTSGVASTLTDSYATGTVNGGFYVGGLVGDVELSTISRTYAANAVNSPYDPGGLIGTNGVYGDSYPGYGPGTITNSYWNTTLAGAGVPGIGFDSGSGNSVTGLNTSQMQNSANFQGFDFTNVWSPAGGGFAPQLYGVSYVVRVDAAGNFQYGDPITPGFYGLQNGDTSSIITGLSFTTNAPGRPQVGETYTGNASGASATSSSGVAYRFIYNNGAINITPRLITIQADDASKTYGQSDPTFTWEITSGSLLSGDSITGALSRDAGNNAGSYDITQGTLAINSNYTIDFLGATFTINPATLTYTADLASRTYGSNNPAFTGTVTGFVNGDTLLSATSGTLSFLSSATAASNAGSWAINGSGLTANNGNYVFVQAAGNATALTINPAQLTFTANLASRAYGSSNGTLSGTITGYVLGQTQTNVFNSTSWTSTAGTTTDVGNYLITGNGSFKSGMSGNYVIVQAASNSTALTITPKTLNWSITGGGSSSTYGTLGSLGTVSLTGVVSGDASKVSGVTGLFDSNGVLVAYLATTDAGSYTEKAASLTGTKALDYVLATTGTTKAFTINPKQLTYSVANASGTYGTIATLGTVTLTGVLGADSGLVSGTAGLFSGSTPVTYVFNTAAGTYTEKVTGLAGTKAGNYSIAASGNTNGTFTINKATLTYSTADAGGTYGTLSALGAITFSGLVAGDGSNITGTEALFSGATPVSYVFNTGVGGYLEKVTGISGTGSSNYQLATSGNTIGTFTISPLAITVKADDKSRKYGNPNPTLTYQITSGGLVTGDSLTGALTTGATVTSDVGGYAITQGTLAASANYNLSFVPGTLTIAARTLDISADNESRLYGDANPSFTYQITGGDGLVNGDELTGSLATVADAHSNVGNYGITQGSLTAGGNYAIDFTNGTLSVTARTLDISADNKSRLYGDANPSFTYQITGGDGLVNGDELTGSLATVADTHSDVGNYAITQGSLTAGDNYAIDFTNGSLSVTARTLDISADNKSRLYGDANPSFTYQITGGDGLVNGDTLSGALTTVADGYSGVGTYDITQGGLTGSANYTIDFTNGTLTIAARALDISADDKSRLYGDSNPTLTYQITGGDGLVNGDGLSGALATAADTNSNAGGYAITQGSLTAGGNYTISFTDGTLSVTPRALTVTADALSRIYGNTNPALTYVLSGDGLVNGDTLSGGLATAANTNSGVGNYAITQGTLAASSNYALTYVGATLAITARPLTITADDLSRMYGDANPALTYVVGGDGLVNGDTLTGALVTAANGSSGVGNYTIGQGTLAASSNYAVTYIGGTLSVTPRNLTITADDLSRLYGDANPALTYTIGGSGLVNGDTLSGGLATAAGLTSNVGNYAITQGSLAASSNYAVTYVGGTLTVTARPLTITADDLSRIYGDANPALTYTVGGSGLVNGDTLTGALATAANSTSNVGSYAITQGSLATSSNYAVTYVGGSLSVTPRAITVTADDLSRIYGSANPLLTYAIGGDGLVNGDTLTGAPATSAGTHSNVGSYAITQGSLAASSNYVLTFAPGTLAITPAALIIAADDISAPSLDQAHPTASYIGLVAGDTSAVVSGLKLGLFPIDGNPFGYDIVPFGASAQNYAISFRAGLLTLTAQPPGGFTTPVTPGGPLGTLPNLVLVTPSGTFSFSNVATAALGGDNSIVLFDAGLPGEIGSFGQFIITDYSNATNDNDRLVAAE